MLAEALLSPSCGSPIPAVRCHSVIPFSLLYTPRTNRIGFLSTAHSPASSSKRNFSVGVLVGRRRDNYALSESDTDDSDSEEYEYRERRVLDTKEMVVPSVITKEGRKQKPRTGGGDEIRDNVGNKMQKNVLPIVVKDVSKENSRAVIRVKNDRDADTQKKVPIVTTKKKRRKVELKSKVISSLEEEAPEITSGVRVLVSRLPKKKNIYRDLIPVLNMYGVVNIIPAEYEDKKTKNLMCKGVAFVDLHSMAVANKFLRMISGGTFTFGGMKKRITCNIFKVMSVNPEPEPPVAGIKEEERDMAHESDDSKREESSVMSRVQREVLENKKQLGREKIAEGSSRISSGTRKLGSARKNGGMKELGDGRARFQ